MNLKDFDDCCAVLRETADKIVAVKRPDYTRENIDVLINFKRAAEEAGVTPLQAWWIHFHKQYSAIARFVNNPKCNPSEPIIMRFADLRNYLYLGFALHQEELANLQTNPVGLEIMQCPSINTIVQPNVQCRLAKGHMGTHDANGNLKWND